MEFKIVIKDKKNIPLLIKGKNIDDFKNIIIKESKAGEIYEIKINSKPTRVFFTPDGQLWFNDKYGNTLIENILITTNEEFYSYIIYSEIEDILINNKKNGIIKSFSLEILNNNIYYSGVIKSETFGVRNIEGIFNSKEYLSTIDKIDIISKIIEDNNI